VEPHYPRRRNRGFKRFNEVPEILRTLSNVQKASKLLAAGVGLRRASPVELTALSGLHAT